MNIRVNGIAADDLLGLGQPRFLSGGLWRESMVGSAGMRRIALAVLAIAVIAALLAATLRGDAQWRQEQRIREVVLSVLSHREDAIFMNEVMY